MSNRDLLICKRLFQEGRSYSRRGDSFSAGLATSLFQDSTEMCLRAITMKHSLDIKPRPGFEDYLAAISKAALLIPYRERIREVNTARNGFKHSGNHPAPDEARRYCLYTEEFLREAIQVHFELDYAMLSMVDLISQEDVRTELKEFEKLRLANGPAYGLEHLAKAKEMLFRRLDRLLPKPDMQIAKITPFLNSLRDFVIASILQIPMEEYVFLERSLSNIRAYRTMDGKWHCHSSSNRDLSGEDVSRIVAILVEVSIQLSRHVNE